MAKTSMSKLAEANWDALEIDVVERIRFLKASSSHLAKHEGTEWVDKLANDIYLPCLELLAEFCGCVRMEQKDIHNGP